ncbi:hypothetical protein SBA1_1040093 [Candidatus Sulfotelmatobacter kueseliae]|uniref:Uncharacterized protein n=1 Tax=Candidatus Sulfotelmatobacter kueseliae TaxID=2042962 RepID=A0A2U3JY25_9BACT|nr:hypothetical protein SBA1_1040093 [Candidatus Sulfotelmatobacter kueseliae]
MPRGGAAISTSVPRRLKPFFHSQSIAALKALRHPKAVLHRFRFRFELHPFPLLPHLKLDNDPLRFYHVLDIKALARNKSLSAKDLSSLGGPFYEQDYRN